MCGSRVPARAAAAADRAQRRPSTRARALARCHVHCVLLQQHDGSSGHLSAMFMAFLRARMGFAVHVCECIVYKERARNTLCGRFAFLSSQH